MYRYARFATANIQTGIEITDDEMRIATVLIHKKQVSLQQCQTVPIRAALSDIDATDPLVLALMQLRATLPCKRSTIILALPHEQILDKTVVLHHALCNREFERYLENGAMALWGRALDTVYYDYRRIAFAHTDGSDYAWQIFVAQRPDVDRLILACKKARLLLGAITIDSVALQACSQKSVIVQAPFDVAFALAVWGISYVC